MVRSVDVSGDKAIHLATRQQVPLTGSSAIPNTVNGDYTVYMTYQYTNASHNYADFSVRLTSAPPVTGEVIFGRVINDSSGNITSISYSNRTRGTVDADNSDVLVSEKQPLQNYNVGNRQYNDTHFVKKAANASTFTLSGTTSSGSTQITGISSTTNVKVGMGISGTGIPSEAFVITVESSTVIIISQPATASATNTFTFTPKYDVEILNAADGTNSSNLTATLTGSRIWTLQDRTMTLADDRAAFQLGDIKATLSQITASDSQPWFDINQTGVVNATNWPLLAPYLRSLVGYVNGSTNLSITGIANHSGFVTLSLSPGATTTAFLLALNEDYIANGSSFVNWRTLTINSTIATLPAGTYGIQNFSTGSNTIDITVNYAGITGTGTASYYPFRLPDATSATNAYWFAVSDATLRTVGGDVIPYFLVRDRFQGFKFTASSTLTSFGNGTAEGVVDIGSAPGVFIVGSTHTTSPTSLDYSASITTTLTGPSDDGTNGTPRNGLTTRDRSIGVFKYIYGKTYVP